MKSQSVLLKVLGSHSQSESYSDGVRDRVSQHSRKTERHRESESELFAIFEALGKG